MAQSFVLSDVLFIQPFYAYLGLRSDNPEHAQGREWYSARKRCRRNDLDSHLTNPVNLPEPQDSQAYQGPPRHGKGSQSRIISE